MPTIRLKEGDFGSEVPVTVGSTDLYLPDPARPGAVAPVPLTAVEEIDSLKSDNSARLMAAAKLSGRGFMTAGPLGLAAGLLAARHVADVVFSVRLKDGRAFTAVADARTFAELHAAQIAARAEAAREGVGADDIIEKYLRAQTTEPARPPETPALAKPVANPAPPAAPIPRPVFGRRGR